MQLLHCVRVGALVVALGCAARAASGAGGAAAAATEAAKPAASVHYLYLIRHGIYDPERGADDFTGNGLNAQGHEQARLAGARLAALPVRFATLATSPYRRARESADDVGRALGMTPVVDSLLHECSPTASRADYTKNHSAADVAACDSTLALAWARWFVPTPDADRHDVLVCHANVIRWLVARATSGDARRWPGFELANGSLTVLAVRPDGEVRLVVYDDVGHLPLPVQTWTSGGSPWNRPPAPVR